MALALPATAQFVDESEGDDTESEIAEEEAIAADSDGSLDDASNSIDVRNVLEGVSVTADIRAGYFQSKIDERDNSSHSEDFIGGRWRFRTAIVMVPYLRAVGRIAGLCSNDECSPNPVLEDSIPTTNGSNMSRSRKTMIPKTTTMANQKPIR